MGGDGSETFLAEHNRAVVACERCPRLRAWCEQIAAEKRAAYREETYWGKPVPTFGDPDAHRLIIGLAPAAHGGNRTGRIFTGDRSGDWLFRALYKAGVANQPISVGRDDGLELSGVLITAVAHCAPPLNKLLPEEILNCRVHLAPLLESRTWTSFLCLGSIAWDQLHRNLGVKPVVRFAHSASAELPSGARVTASYHPSQQNTFTGRLTEAMLDDAVATFLRY